MNSSEMLLAISRESQLMILLHSEVTENDHIISHTDWDLKPLIKTDWYSLVKTGQLHMACVLHSATKLHKESETTKNKVPF